MNDDFVVRLSAGPAYCSGVLISPDLNAAEAHTEYLLTCGHFIPYVTAPVHVTGQRVDALVLDSVHIPRTDLAVVRVDRASSAAQLLRVSTSRPPLFARALTLGFGGSSVRATERHGRVWARSSASISRNGQIVIRPSAVLWNTPPTVGGDSGAPVIIGDELVALQSIGNDWGGNVIRFGSSQQLAPHRPAIAEAVATLRHRH
ncbi:hypothetical protein CATRI_06505 [Corynebacterium atrinae]|nr:hypothetical protein CATRI_06505 [Corynebacterium atrinae]